MKKEKEEKAARRTINDLAKRRKGKRHGRQYSRLLTPMSRQYYSMFSVFYYVAYIPTPTPHAHLLHLPTRHRCINSVLPTFVLPTQVPLLPPYPSVDLWRARIPVLLRWFLVPTRIYAAYHCCRVKHYWLPRDDFLRFTRCRLDTY